MDISVIAADLSRARAFEALESSAGCFGVYLHYQQISDFTNIFNNRNGILNIFGACRTQGLDY